MPRWFHFVTFTFTHLDHINKLGGGANGSLSEKKDRMSEAIVQIIGEHPSVLLYWGETIKKRTLIEI